MTPTNVASLTGMQDAHLNELDRVISHGTMADFTRSALKEISEKLRKTNEDIFEMYVKEKIDYNNE